MKRRNSDTGKLRRPMKRTKITEGMYGNSMLYVKFVLLWSSVALADYMLEFRFEFLWPLWLLLKAVYHCYHCKGLAFTVFFTCIALSSDMVCYFFIPTQILTYLAGLYVWMHSIWTTFESKGVCAQTLGMWCLCVYAEALRTGMISAALSGALEPETEDWSTKHWPAHALGFPIVSLGVGVKQLVDEKLRLRTQRRVRAQNEFYFKLMREALPEDGATSTYSSELFGEVDAGLSTGKQKRWKPDTNGHCVHACPLKDKSDRERDTERKDIQAKLEHLEQHLEKKNRTRDSSTQSQKSAQNVPNGIPNHVPNGVHNSIPNSVHSSVHSVPNSVQSSSQPSPHAPHTNGSAKGAGFLDEDKHNHCKGGAKSTKYDKKEATTLKEDKRRKKNRDLDKEIIDSHKNTENTKEQVDKELESTKELFKKECNNINKERDKEREEERRREKEEEKKREEERKREREEEKRREREEDKRREKERERELKEREKERERERDRERELLSARECAEELSKVRAALAAALRSEAETARQLSAERAAERQRRAAHQDLKQQLQQKMSTWRCGEKAALERKLGEERRARLAAEQQLLKVTRAPHGECESEWCKSRRSAADAESATLRKDLQRTRDRLGQLQRDLNLANEQVALLEGEKAACQGGCVQNGAGAIHALQARAAHLECVLSAETRVKLDLLSALGDANRKMHIQDSVIHRQEKELEELKAQMLAVMPTDFVGPSQSSMSKMRLSEASPLDPNASVYTPKQLCSDA